MSYPLSQERIIVHAGPLLNNIYQSLVCDDEPVDLKEGITNVLSDLLFDSEGYPIMYWTPTENVDSLFQTPEGKHIDCNDDMRLYIGTAMLYHYGPFKYCRVTLLMLLGNDILLEVLDVSGE